jgi:hypothetical protein
MMFSLRVAKLPVGLISLWGRGHTYTYAISCAYASALYYTDALTSFISAILAAGEQRDHSVLQFAIISICCVNTIILFYCEAELVILLLIAQQRDLCLFHMLLNRLQLIIEIDCKLLTLEAE